ncbi:hypothetical protein [Enterovibrio norvegicus]|uniref:hypothetical protein n=1 Tax=Enterovibrio norvegicus TaxID=188144 RepID=UPI00352DD94A
MRTNIFLMLASAVVLSGCSTSPDYADMQRVEKAEKQEMLVEQTEKTLANLPDWFLNAPADTSEGIYATGTAKGKDLSFTLAKATLDADFKVSKKVQQMISGLERSFTRETDAGDFDEGNEFMREAEQVVERLVKKVDLTGARVVKSEMLQEGSNYRSYVLVYLPKTPTFTREIEKTRREAESAYAELGAKIADIGEDAE